MVTQPLEAMSQNEGRVGDAGRGGRGLFRFMFNYSIYYFLTDAEAEHNPSLTSQRLRSVLHSLKTRKNRCSFQQNILVTCIDL